MVSSHVWEWSDVLGVGESTSSLWVWLSTGTRNRRGKISIIFSLLYNTTSLFRKSPVWISDRIPPTFLAKIFHGFFQYVKSKCRELTRIHPLCSCILLFSIWYKMRCYVSSESKTRSGLKVVGIYLILLGFSYLINFMVEREATLLFVLEFSDSNPAFD